MNHYDFGIVFTSHKADWEQIVAPGFIYSDTTQFSSAFERIIERQTALVCLARSRKYKFTPVLVILDRVNFVPPHFSSDLRIHIEHVYPRLFTTKLFLAGWKFWSRIAIDGPKFRPKEVRSEAPA